MSDSFDEYSQVVADAMIAYCVRYGLERTHFRAALIDMDGTLYDSMVNHTAAWHRLATELGIDVPRDSFYLVEGMTGKSTINKLYKEHLNSVPTDDEVVELYRRKTQYFNELPAVKPMPAADCFINYLIGQRIARVLVTGSGQHSLIDRLRRDFPGGFTPERMITAADVVHGKPDPEPYLKGMDRAGVNSIEAVVVENAPIGVEAGARSGAFTIGITTGPIPAETLKSAGADLVLPSMAALAHFANIIFQ